MIQNRDILLCIESKRGYILLTIVFKFYGDSISRNIAKSSQRKSKENIQEDGAEM